MERKRHIGNDIVNIVFIDSDDSEDFEFSPSCIKSQFTRILFKFVCLVERTFYIYKKNWPFSTYSCLIEFPFRMTFDAGNANNF